MKSIYVNSTPTVGFTAESAPIGAAASVSASQGWGGDSDGRGGPCGGRGRGHRPPHCQLCRQNCHFANACPQLPTFASKSAPSEANLAKAFFANCCVTPLCKLLCDPTWPVLVY